MNYITAHKMYKQAKAENLRASLGQGRGLGPGLGRIDGTGLGLTEEDLTDYREVLAHQKRMAIREARAVDTLNASLLGGIAGTVVGAGTGAVIGGRTHAVPGALVGGMAGLGTGIVVGGGVGLLKNLIGNNKAAV